MLKPVEKDNLSKLERIYEKYRVIMYREAYNILHDANDAEDAMQQSFLKLIKYLDKIKEEEVGMTCNFLKIVVRNISIDIYKKRLYLNTKEDAIDMVDDFTTGRTNEVSDLVIDKESVRIISDEIKRLPEIYRDVLLLEKVYGYSREETIRILGSNYETLKKRLTRAKTKLLDALRKEGLTDGKENLRKND